MEEKKTQIKISCAAGGYVFLILALGLFWLPFTPLLRTENCWLGILILFSLGGSFFLFFAIICGMSYIFDDDGIRCLFVGVRYRTIRWEDITGFLILATGDRSGEEGIFICLEGGMMCYPKGKTNIWGNTDNTIGDLCFQNKGLFKSILRGKNQFIIGSSSKNWEAAVQLVQTKVNPNQGDQGTLP